MTGSPPSNLDSDWLADRTLSARMVRAWPAFFARFGRLTEVQRVAAGPILEGRSILVCAPTAAGKTEAACAPLVERHCRRSDAWTVLYISPTRALVNDLYERLVTPLAAMDLSVSRRTGDYHDNIERDQPHVLLTTPESFDSLLCRGRHPERGHVLAHVEALVLDEVHLLAGTARGEQVRWQLERLRRLRRFGTEEGWRSPAALQIVGLSATLPDPQLVLDQYIGSGAELIQVAGAREIELVYPGESPSPVEEQLPAYIAALERPEKILIFSNAKKRVDELASALHPVLHPLGYLSLGHHAALARPERERAESAVKKEKRIVLVSTSTLEIGVDIGDIDLVVLDGPPPDVSSFLQRIGRGNRRTGKTRVMLCAANGADALIQKALLDAARASYLGPVESGPHYAVARQQIASFIFQGPTRQRQESSIADLLRQGMPDVVGERLVAHLTATNELLRDESGIRLGPMWLDASVRGEIHSNIEAPLGRTVVDSASGDAIAVGVRYTGGKRMAIAGASLDVRRVSNFSIDVNRVARGGPSDAQWSYATSRQIRGASQPQAVRRFLGLDEIAWPCLVSVAGVTVFHFGGSRTATCLGLMARRAGVEQLISVDAYRLTLRLAASPEKPEWIIQAGPSTLDILVADMIDRLEADLGRPRANKALPLELRLAEVRGWLGLEERIADIQRSVWIQPTPRQTELLAALI